MNALDRIGFTLDAQANLLVVGYLMQASLSGIVRNFRKSVALNPSP